MVTFKESGVTLLATTLQLDQAQLFNLLQDGSYDFPDLIKFFKNFQIINRVGLSNLLKNKKVNIFHEIC